MRIIAHANLSAFWAKHPETRTALERWTVVMKGADCGTMAEVQALFSKAKVLDGQRVCFEISGGDYRLIASFKFKKDWSSSSSSAIMPSMTASTP